MRDAYVLPMVLGFDARERLEAFLSAVRRVIGRHDILRSAVVWQGLREPVQVVVREAVLPVREVVLAGGEDPVAALLAAGTDPLDIGSAPLLRVFIAAQPEGDGRWLGLLQVHHLVQDHTGLARVSPLAHLWPAFLLVRDGFREVDVYYPRRQTCWSAGWCVAADGEEFGELTLGVVHVGEHALSAGAALAAVVVEQHGLLDTCELRDQLAHRQVQSGAGGLAAHQVGDGQGQHSVEDVDADLGVGPVVHRAEGDHVRVLQLA